MVTSNGKNHVPEKEGTWFFCVVNKFKRNITYVDKYPLGFSYVSVIGIV